MSTLIIAAISVGIFLALVIVYEIIQVFVIEKRLGITQTPQKKEISPRASAEPIIEVDPDHPDEGKPPVHLENTLSEFVQK